MDRFDPFVKYADVYGDIINWEKDPMNKPQNQNKYFFSDGKTYYEQICKMLRLMSVFKEAFNQIYSNEDEISEAWENFVNNLSASVVEGSEPDVTLTWTDDSVNFEFTMVPGVPGEQGVGITSISFNSDYTMTITLSDGNSYTSMSLKGETGPQGPQGETGSGLQILDVYATLADLQSAHPTGQPGDAYQVGSAGNYILYIWSSSQSAWVPAGSLGTVSPSLSNPLMDGTASAGSQNLYSRGDHVHPTDTSRASKEELDALIKTSQALIDQSFTYRESPAIQDGLARIDKIKGNTLVWNQLLQSLAPTTTRSGVTFTKNNDGTWTLNGTATANIDFRFDQTNTVIANPRTYYANHKYLLKVNKVDGVRLGIMQQSTWAEPLSTSRNTGAYDMQTLSQTYENMFAYFFVTSGTSFANVVLKPQLFDLTQMGLDSITNPAEFTSLFPLPYYDYNASTLLSFNGTGLKTTGKNLLNSTLDTIVVSGVTCTKNADGSYTFNGTATTDGYFRLVDEYQFNIPSSVYISAISNNSSLFANFGIDKYDNSIADSSFASLGTDLLVNHPSNIRRVWIRTRSGATYDNVKVYPMIRFATVSDDTYEPYTSSTLSLPISTYFPTGMKSAGNVYDELTENKAITRAKIITLNGSESWRQGSPEQRFYLDGFVTDFKNNSNGMASNGWVVEPSSESATSGEDKVLFQITGTTYRINLFANKLGITSTSNLITYLQNNPLTICYELATPTETAVDPDLSFNAYENGTEQLLPVNGSVPSTSPIIADMTYLSIDDAMEYVLEKLANVPQNTQQILESLEDDVADLQTDVGALQPAVSALQTSVGNINTNIGQLSSTVAGHTSSISDMQSDITDLNTGLSNLEDTVTDNTSRIGTLETDMASTDSQVQSIGSSVSTLSTTVSDQGTELGEIDSIIQDISNNAVLSSLGQHELGFVAAYVDATLPANTGTRVTIPKPVIFPNNYTPLFIVGMSTGAYDVSICEIPHTFGNSDSVKCRVWNHGGEKTTQITVYILCMRQRQSQ